MKGKGPMMKALVGKQHNLPEELKAKIEAAPESPVKKYASDDQRKAVHASKADSAVKKTKEDRIRGRKGGRTASVTNRLNEGNIKGAKLARRTAVASSKGKKAKADRLQRKVESQDSKFFKDQVERSRAK